MKSTFTPHVASSSYQNTTFNRSTFCPGHKLRADQDGAPCSKDKMSLFACVYIEWNSNDFLSAGFSATAAPLVGVEVEFIASLYHAVVDLVCSCSWLYLTHIWVSWRRGYRRSHSDTHKSTEVEGHEYPHPWWSVIPRLIFCKLAIWPLCGDLLSLPLFSQAFDLTTLWYAVLISVSENFCDDWWNRGFHMSLNLTSFLTSFSYDHHVK